MQLKLEIYRPLKCDNTIYIIWLQTSDFCENWPQDPQRTIWMGNELIYENAL